MCYNSQWHNYISTLTLFSRELNMGQTEQNDMFVLPTMNLCKAEQRLSTTVINIYLWIHTNDFKLLSIFFTELYVPKTGIYWKLNLANYLR